jgi:hypothetical protein
LPVLLVESEEMLNLGFFVCFAQLKICIDESGDASDGDNPCEEGSQSFRSELAKHWRESYPVPDIAASCFNPQLPRATTRANYPLADLNSGVKIN